MKPPKASMKVMKAWLPRIGSFLKNAIQRSRGGGRIKVGTLMTSTKISQSSSSTAKKTTGSATFFHEDFTGALRADVRGNHRCCQENGPGTVCGNFLADLPVFETSPNLSVRPRSTSLRANSREKSLFEFNE